MRIFFLLWSVDRLSVPPPPPVTHPIIRPIPYCTLLCSALVKNACWGSGGGIGISGYFFCQGGNVLLSFYSPPPLLLDFIFILFYFQCSSGGCNKYHYYLSAEVDIDVMPLLLGASEVVAGGIVSTLQGKNEHYAFGFLGRTSSTETALNSRTGSGNAAATAAVEARAFPAEVSAVLKHPSFRLLFDPQTAGGLLASVPQDRVDACVEALAKAGCEDAAVIGTIKDGRPKGTPIITIVRSASPPPSGDALCT
ncbi:unnamed protein product [Choristocarpus tenellus]